MSEKVVCSADDLSAFSRKSTQMDNGRSTWGRGHPTVSRKATDMVVMGLIVAQVIVHCNVPTAGAAVTSMDPPGSGEG